MAYLNLDLDYLDHPKTKRLIGLLGKGSEAVPIRLWIYCGRFHAESGRLTGYSAQEIESAIGWWGETGKAVEALLKVGFLERQEGEYLVHEWSAYQGHMWALMMRNKKVAVNRWKRLKSGPLPSIPVVYQKANPGIPHAVPYHTKPNNTSPPTPSPGAQGFEQFWEAYPRKVGKKAALRAWEKAKDRPDIERILVAVEAQKRSEAWRKDGGEFIPHPATWLNQGRWDDEVRRRYSGPPPLPGGKRPLDVIREWEDKKQQEANDGAATTSTAGTV